MRISRTGVICAKQGSGQSAIIRLKSAKSCGGGVKGCDRSPECFIDSAYGDWKRFDYQRAGDVEMLLDPGMARKALAGVRIFNGTAALIVPQLLLRRLGTDPDVDRSGVYPFRMFGIRTVLIGVDLLTLQGEERRRATRVAVLIHATDTVSAVIAGLRGHLSPRAAVMTTLISSGNTALAVLAMRE
jgi:hypothetical protein